MSYTENLHGGKIIDLIKDSKEKYIDFSANINSYGLDKRIKKEIVLTVDNIKHYPSTNYKKLSEKICYIHNIDKDFIHLGNGASDLIYRLAVCFFLLKNNKLRISLPYPSFIEYEKSFEAFDNIEKSYYRLDFDKPFNLEELNLANTDIIYICNPNNPSSTLISKKKLFDLANRCKKQKIFLIIDECFMDFVNNEEEYSLISEIKNNKYIIILRSFTKIFALAGLRLGYILSSNKDILTKMDNLFPTWNINSLAFVAGNFACEIYDDIRKKVLISIEKERVYLTKNLKKLNFKVYESKANFILFKNFYDIDLEKELLKNNILIRSCANFKGLDKTYYRIAIKSRKENRILIKFLGELIR